MKWFAALIVGGLALSACRMDDESVLAGSGELPRNTDGQTIVPEYFSIRGYVMTDAYLESEEGKAVAAALRAAGARSLSVLTSASRGLNEPGFVGIPVEDWKGGRWARDVGPVSAVSHSSEALRLVQLGPVTEAARAIGSWLNREIVAGPSLAHGASIMINGYADCFLSKFDVSAAQEDEIVAQFHDLAGCRRVTLLDQIRTMSVTKQLDQWVRFFSNDEVAVARLVDLTGRENTGASPSLQRLRKFWDDQARAMSERGYQVIRLPVFVHREATRRFFSSTIAGLIVQQRYLAPDFPSLRAAFGERFEVERAALVRDLRSLGFEVEWVPGEESARLGGSIHRAILPVHENA